MHTGGGSVTVSGGLVEPLCQVLAGPIRPAGGNACGDRRTTAGRRRSTTPVQRSRAGAQPTATEPASARPAGAEPADARPSDTQPEAQSFYASQIRNPGDSYD